MCSSHGTPIWSLAGLTTNREMKWGRNESGMRRHVCAGGEDNRSISCLALGTLAGSGRGRGVGNK